MLDSSSPAALVPPILGAIVLVVGTGSAVYLNARKRREAKREAIRQKRKQEDTDEESGQGTGRVPSQKDVERQQVEQQVEDPPQASIEDGMTELQEDPPLLLPTVSAATSDFMSLTYNIFVVTAFVHGACLVLTGLLQKDATSKVAAEKDSAYASTMGTLLVVGACIGAAGIILTSLIPARGRGTVPHIAFGFVFIEAAIVWMVWTCMVTLTIGGSVGLLVIRVILATICCAAMVFASISTYKTMKLRGKEGVEDQWFQLMHRTAIGQLGFGFFYAVFLGTVAADFN